MRPGQAAPVVRTAGLYFRVVFGATLLLELPMILALRGHLPGPPDRYAPLVLLAVFSPMLTALVLARREHSLSDLLRGLDPRRAPPAAYALAFLLPSTLLFVGMTAYRTVTHPGPGWWLPRTSEQLLGMAFFPFVDQLGWRGYAYPRLRDRHGVLVATGVIALAWPAWHIAKHAFLGTALPAPYLPLQVLSCAGATVFYSWLYERTRDSLLVVVAAQMGAYLNNSFSTLPGDPTALIVQTVGYALLAPFLLRTLAARSGMPLRAVDA